MHFNRHKFKSGVAGWVLASAIVGVAPLTTTSHALAADADNNETATADAERPSDGPILVTARRRSEAAQSVPVSLSVVSAETLEQSGTYNIGQISQLVPSLQVYSFNPRNTNINIRGLGSNVALTNDGLENGVGFYVDGVYYGRPGQTQFDLVDLAQIEVLRGPQGTLFGKNTTAGAINITTRAPSFTPEGSAEISVGDHNNTQVRLQSSGPISENVAYRLTGSYTRRGGTIENVTQHHRAGEYDNFSVRGQLLFNFTDNVNLRIIGDWSDQHQLCCISVLVGAARTYADGATIANNWYDRVARTGYTQLPFDPFARRTDANSHYQADQSTQGLSAELNWNLGFATLTSLTAYRIWHWFPSNDADATGLAVTTTAQQVNKQDQLSQEVRLTSNNDGPVDWVLGAYYFNQVVDGFGATRFGPDAAAWNFAAPAQITSGNVALNGFGTDSFSSPETNSYAGFAQANWHITDRLDLTGGIRYTQETKDGVYQAVQVGGAVLADVLTTPAQIAGATAIRNQFTPAASYITHRSDSGIGTLLSLSYQADENFLIYGNYATGSKSGGLNLTTLPAGVRPEVDPEDVTSREVGFKSQWLDRTLTVNAAVYESTIDNYQSAITEQVGTTSAFRQYIANIPQVRSRGLEWDVAWRATPNLSLTASGAVTAAEYVRYTNAPNAPERLNINGLQDLSGTQLPGIPRQIFSLAGDYSHPLGQLAGKPAEIYARADYSSRTGFNTSNTNSRYTLVPGYALLNLRVGYRTADGAIDVAAYARNAVDEDYYQALSVSNFSSVTGLLGDPRTIGVNFRVRY